MLRKKINIHTLGSRINGGWGGGGHNQISRGGGRNKWDEGVANFDKNKKKRNICKYEHNNNNNKVKNYTVDNVVAYNNKTIRNMH